MVMALTVEGQESPTVQKWGLFYLFYCHPFIHVDTEISGTELTSFNLYFESYFH